MTLIFLLLAGCFRLPGDMAELDTTLVPMDNPHLTRDDVVVAAVETTLICPGGEPARFFAVYSESAEQPAPAAIVLHSGAFDYVMDATGSGPLDGPHYQAPSRLDARFATSKVWETLGMQIDDLDPAERNLGTLPAAVADAGMLQLIPGNCWGDLWHNEVGRQESDADVDGFSRNGLGLAWHTVRMLTEEGFAATENTPLPISVDPSQLYLFGLGEGGRGVAELLLHEGMPPVAGALVDSSADLLSPYLDDPITFEDEIEGYTRIFGADALSHIDDWSLTQAPTLPDRLAYLWSDGDPQLLTDATAPSASALRNNPGVWVENTGATDHVLSNSDPNLAAAVVDHLLGR